MPQLLWNSFIKRRLNALNILYTEEVVERLKAYTELLIATNQKINLISRKHDTFEIIFKEHIDDSLLGAYFFLRMEKEFKKQGNSQLHIADIGSGAGLPGLPLACIFPQMKFDLIESQHKRAQFLKNVCSSLDLTHVDVVRQNIFEVRKYYDLITARALAPLAKIVKLSQHLLRPSGHGASRYLLYKGQVSRVNEEVEFFYKTLPTSMQAKIKCHDLKCETKERTLVELVMSEKHNG